MICLPDACLSDPSFVSILTPTASSCTLARPVNLPGGCCSSSSASQIFAFHLHFGHGQSQTTSGAATRFPMATRSPAGWIQSFRLASKLRPVALPDRAISKAAQATAVPGCPRACPNSQTWPSRLCQCQSIWHQ